MIRIPILLLALVTVSPAYGGIIEVHGPVAKGTLVSLGHVEGTIFSVTDEGIRLQVLRRNIKELEKRGDRETLELVDFYMDVEWDRDSVLLFIPHPDLEGGGVMITWRRMRITVPGAERSFDRYGTTMDRQHEGTYISFADDTLAMTPKGNEADTLRVPASRIVKVEIVSGRTSHAVRGAVVGAVVGAAAGVGLAAGYAEDCGFGCILVPPIGAGAGMMVGGILGTILRTDRWVEVPVDRLDVGFSVLPDGGPGVGVKVRF